MELQRFKLPFKSKAAVLAFGSQTKSRVCFIKGDTALLSPVYKDLGDAADFLDFKKTVDSLLRKKPKLLAADMHPGYQSSIYARQAASGRLVLRLVQHHHAHVVSCMAENGVAEGKVIGVAFDGTGLGCDGDMWGAEFLICGYRSFARACHLKSIPLLGGEKAISQPWRLAAWWLYEAYGGRFLKLPPGVIKPVKKNDWLLLKKAHEARIGWPLASSMGRLFDAAACIVLGKGSALFEAQLAIEFERLASGYKGVTPGSYEFGLMAREGSLLLDPAPIFRGIVSDLRARIPKQAIAMKFHRSVAKMTGSACLALRRKTGLNKVVLSGGVFQNNLLLKMVLDLLYEHKFIVMTHKRLSCNDSGISLGQALVAQAGGSSCA